MFSYKYPHPAVTTDCVIFGFDGTRLQVLLIERGLEPYKGKWAFPGGFMKMDESAEQGAKRELMEETGMKAEYMEQFHAFTDPDRDPRERVITIAYYALCKIQEVKGGDDAAKAQWFSIDKIPQLAFEHSASRPFCSARTSSFPAYRLRSVTRKVHYERAAVVV